MAIFASSQIDELRDLLDDAADAQVTLANKIFYLNLGQRAMWPRVFRIAQDSTTLFVDDQVEYVLPAAVRGGRLVLLEKSVADNPTFFSPMNFGDYQLIPGLGGADIIETSWDPGSVWEGGVIRITAAMPLSAYVSTTYVGLQSEAYTGPDYTAEGPVLYAMSRITAKPLDKRIDYERYSVQNQNRAASPQEILAASAYWLDEFERRLEEWKMAMPVGRY